MVRPFTVFIILVFATLAALPLLWQLPNPTNEAWVRQLHDAGHVPLFALLQGLAIWWIHRLKHPRLPIVLLVLVSAFLMFLLGGAIEFVQSFINRSASLRDLGLDALGIAIALGVYACYRGLRKPWSLIGCGIIVFVGLAITVYPAVVWFQATSRAKQAFPVLMDAEFRKDPRVRGLRAGRVRVAQAPSTWQAGAGRAVAVYLPADAPLAGWGLVEMPRNWRGYSTLAFNAWSEADEAVKFGVNLYSKLNKQRLLGVTAVHLQPGANEIALPLHGFSPFNAEHVIALSWHALDSPETVVWFDYVRLEDRIPHPQEP